MLLSELYREPELGRELMRLFPTRPGHFRLDAEHELKTPEPSREWRFQFMDRGRLLMAAVVLGPDASAGVRLDFIRVLNGLRFGPPAPAGEA